MSARQKRILIAIALAIPTFVMIAAIFFGKQRFQHSRQAPPPKGVHKELIAKWNSQKFESLQDAAKIKQIVDEFRFVYSDPLTAIEKVALDNAIVEFVESYQQGTFESITKWRIPVKLFHFSKGISNAMIKRYSIPVSMIQTSPELAWQKWWWATRKDEYTNYWIGISVTNCEVQVTKNTTLTNDLLQVLKKIKVENVGYSILDPSILFENSPENILQSSGSIKYAIIRILPQIRDHEPLYPVYLRSYWSPEDEKWLPESLICTYARSDRVRDIFF